MKRMCATLTCCLLLAAAAAADVVTMKDGRKFEGTVLEQTAEKVVIKTKFGVNELKAADVASVEIKSTPEEEFKQRREAAAGDAKALFDLYVWATSSGLKNQAKIALRDVIKVDPNHEEARRLLGYVRFEDRWVTEKERERLAADKERKDNEAKGLVLHEGKWMTPEEKEEAVNLAKGMVKVEGQWVDMKDKARKEEEAKRRQEAEEHRAKGEFFVNGKWIPRKEAEAFFADVQNPYRTEGDHILLCTNNGIEFGDRMLVTAEAAYRKAKDLLGAEPKLDGRKLPVFVVASLEDYNLLGNRMGADEKSSNYPAFVTPWLPEDQAGFDMVSVTQYYKDVSLTEVYVHHAVVEQYVRRIMGPTAADPAPRWFIDGVSSYIERWQGPKLFSWTRDRLIAVGGLLKMKTYFGSYQPSEQCILSGGLLTAFVKSDKCPEELLKEWNDSVAAVIAGEGVQKAFRSLEKAFTKHEDALREFGNL